MTSLAQHLYIRRGAARLVRQHAPLLSARSFPRPLSQTAIQREGDRPVGDRNTLNPEHWEETSGGGTHEQVASDSGKGASQGHTTEPNGAGKREGESAFDPHVTRPGPEEKIRAPNKDTGGVGFDFLDGSSREHGLSKPQGDNPKPGKVEDPRAKRSGFGSGKKGKSA